MTKRQRAEYRRQVRALGEKLSMGKGSKSAKVTQNFMRPPGDKSPFPHPCDWPGCEKPWMFVRMRGKKVEAIRCHGHLEMGESSNAEQAGSTGDVHGRGRGVDVHASVGGDGRQVAEPHIDDRRSPSGEPGDG